MVIVTLETICVLVLEALVLREHIMFTPNVMYPILYMLGMLSLLSLCADAMYHRNQIQVVALTFFNVLCCTYGIIQTLYDWKALGAGTTLRAYNVAIATTIGVCSLFLVFATCKLAVVFGWEMYRFLGADLNMRRMHKGYEILITLLKFDVFFFVAYAIQMFTLVDTTDRTIITRFSNGRTLARQQLLVGLAIPGSIILLALAFFGVMKENKLATIFVMVCLLAAEPYFVYELVYLHRPENQQRFVNSAKYLTFFIGVTMLLVLITLFFMMYCFRNFGKGLLISQKSRITTTRRPFEIDEDPVESEASIPLDGKGGEDSASQQLMAYPALKKIQEQYHIQPTNDRPSHDAGHSEKSHHNQTGDKMEID
ncbi:hypothetical protein BGX31_011185 [Mortierella sp. GBA43]|nr:hypothetical protein BGX31_011185 [Mortierella sp. GBA43]